MEEVFRETIREEQRRGDRTVLSSSHILAEVEALCGRVTIIKDGRTVESGSPAGLRHLTRTSIQADLAAPTEELAGLPGLHTEGSRVWFDVDTTDLDAVLRHLTDTGVRALISRPPPWRSCSYGTTTAPAGATGDTQERHHEPSYRHRHRHRHRPPGPPGHPSPEPDHIDGPGRGSPGRRPHAPLRPAPAASPRPAGSPARRSDAHTPTGTTS
ncbi:hypothetical protein GCM10010140_56760 [Streptosporangium pseudovulgare]|uniref:Uncharacterized protein n=1 Tax=Streptosporangium pseudovulgare TaxID=35765 RepID=A0ABQ2R8G9_9ACTN|nr:hypothetical protein GCM10010140_56760 [Streptosporangium pseudovulgare]